MNMFSFKTLLAAFIVSLSGLAFGQGTGGFVVVAEHDVTLDGAPVNVGDAFIPGGEYVYEDDEEEDVDGTEASHLTLRHTLTNIVYRVNSAGDLPVFIAAFNSNTAGDAIGRWAVGGNRQRLDISTITAAVPGGIPSANIVPTVPDRAATPVGP